jgi:hypothetical protein
LENYRLLNDIVEIYDGEIVNLGIHFTIQVEYGLNKREVLYNCITRLKEFFDINKMEMNQPIYLGQVIELLREVNGVINVAELYFTNLKGGNYSNTVLSTINSMSEVLDNINEYPINAINNTIYASPRAMFEIKYPYKDIIGRAI